MLLRDDDPRASILLTWLVTRRLLAPVAADMQRVREVRLPADAEPWIARWDGLTDDLAAPPAAAFLVAFHGRPLEAVLARECGSTRPELATLDVERFERIARAIDRAFATAPADAPRPLDVSLLAAPVRATLEGLGLVWVAHEHAFVRASAELVQRVEVTSWRRSPAAPGHSLRASASVRAPRLDRLRDALTREGVTFDATLLVSPLLGRSGPTHELTSTRRIDALVAPLSHELEGLARWVVTFDSPVKVLAAFAIDDPAWWSTWVPGSDAAWPERRALLSVLHGGVSPADALASADAIYVRLGRTALRRRHDLERLRRLLEHATRHDALAEAAAPPSPRRVRHAKFGTGTVRAEREGKLVIAFDDGVERVLLPRFCSPE
ncbi:hypothetical protein OV203_25335 [Nannocystis sp. ILAH1]|uniref:hypothetical protein n=1 Tax=Nannocystis sp. ILAH1 TaxID=2996789 RepID=UPI002270216E|nr:hypothetical protein [Nannocystis sp. ILAH1]MCY0990490.1 hypothetical protein [Nannocystis sp. ILAH1]